MTTSSPESPAAEGLSWRVPEEAHGWRLDKALGLLLAVPSPEQRAQRPELFALAEKGLRARRRLCERSLVLVGGKPGIPGLKVRAGQDILILPEPEAETALSEAEDAGLVREENGLTALYKPAGMHSAALAGSPAPCLENLLAALLPGFEEGYPRLLNRLDAPTSGLVLAACGEEGERRWRRAERIGQTDKRYLALIEGQPLYDFTVARRLDTDARTKSRVRHSDDPDPLRHTDVALLHPLTAAETGGLVEADGDAPLMLVGCRIRKGARHQIRAHLAAAGHPLAGDDLYGASLRCRGFRFLLHHGRVSLPDFDAFRLPIWLSSLPLEARERAEAFLRG
ncbi:MAG: pseudouridine synthase [Bilophila sp.]